jgi:putative flavoprotein involved in K+ transport
MPRIYRGRDVFAWLHDAGVLDERARDVRDLAAARRAASFPLSGAAGGTSLGLDLLGGRGVVVAGRLEGFANGHALFAADLERELREADKRLERTLERIDAYIERTGAPAPPAWRPAPVVLPPAPRRLDVRAGVRTVLWATGYRRSYPWLHVPVLDSAGELMHREGATASPGLFALGLRLQRTRRSHMVGGVGQDAAVVADAILARSDRALERRAA